MSCVTPLTLPSGNLFRSFAPALRISPRQRPVAVTAKRHYPGRVAPHSSPSGGSDNSGHSNRLVRRLHHRRFGNYERLVPTSLTKPTPKSPLPHQFVNLPAGIKRPPYADSGQVPSDSFVPEIPILTADEIARLRRASKLAKEALEFGGSLVKVGATTAEIDERIYEFITQDKGAYPSPLNYSGYPRSVCTSINNVICHGIPDNRRLVCGDIINIDVTVYKDGFHGDTSYTYLVGEVDEKGRELTQATKEALELGICVCGPGVPFKEIGRVIDEFAVKHGYSVSPELTGHGIGRNFHQLPLIFHHKNDEPGVMQPGMAFTIEPILCQGKPSGVLWPDGWTITTIDGGRSAQFEHTIVVTDDGVEVLTR